MNPTCSARLASKISHISTIFTFVMVVVATLFSVTCSYAGSRTVRVGVYDTKPLAYSDKDGAAHGFFVDMLNRVAEKEQWDMQYVPGTWQEGLDRLKSDKIDMVLCIAYTEERAKYMDFPKEFLLLDWGLIFKPGGSKITSLLDLEGKNVSALKGDVYLTGFKELVRQFNVSVKIHEVDQYPDVFKAVDNGKAEAGVNGNLYGMLNEAGRNLEQTPIIFNPVKLGYAVNKGKNGDLIASLDRDIAEMKADKASIYHRELEHLLGKKNHKIPKEVYWALSGVATALLLAIGFIALLRRQVKVKTSYLLIEIDERKRAEEDLLALRYKLQEQNEELQMNEEELRSQNDELLEAEWKFRALFDNGPIGVAYHSMIYDASGKPVDYIFIDANDNFIDLTGVDPRGKTVTQAFPGIEKDSFDWIGTFGRVAKTGETIHFEQYLQSNNRWYDLVAYQYKPDHFVASFVEITSRKKAEAELIANTEDLREAQRIAHVGSWRLDIASNQAIWSEELYRMYGCDPKLPPPPYTEHQKFFTTESWERLSEALQNTQNTGIPYDLELETLRIDGSSGRMWAYGMPVVDANGVTVGLRGMAQDITERKKAEEALVESEYRWKFALEGAGDGVWDWNIQTGEAFYSQRYKEMLGFAENEIGTTSDEWLKRVHPDDAPMVMTALQPYLDGKAGSPRVEFRMLCKDGSWKWMVGRGMVISRDSTGKPLRMIGTNTDITERKQAEEEKLLLDQQFQHTQKLESLGVLAGGIAHDFNNILAIIMGYCSLTKLDYENSEKNIPEIEKAAERAAALCRQMLAYAGKASLTQTQVNAWMLVDEMVTMLKTTIQKNVVIKPELGTDIPTFTGDASQIRQVVMNLIINAAEAIGDAEGEIDVKLAKAEIKAEQPEKDHLGTIIATGRYICFEVSDNGCGMDDDTRRKIFEPFYTTKFTGRGLGMSAVLGIIKAHNGALQLESQPGQGTTFKIYLPVQPSKTETEEALQKAVSAAWHGSGTILLAEDEVQVKTIATALLQKLGFKVLDAANGKEALELYQQNAADINMVITDMGMPVMNGYELFYKLKQLDPKLPIIISSGFGEGDIGSKIPREEIAGLINKPFNFEHLREVLMKVVEG